MCVARGVSKTGDIRSSSELGYIVLEKIKLSDPVKRTDICIEWEKDWL